MPDMRPPHAASFGLAAFLTILARALGATIPDRGSRETIAGHWRPVGQTPWDVDLRRPMRCKRAKALARTAGLAVGSGCGAIVFYFLSAPIAAFGLTVGLPGFLLEFIVTALIAVGKVYVTPETSATRTLSPGGGGPKPRLQLSAH